uniref:Uncharacterized protein n=1 Tax=Anguilla anguilla TaxID=7936 RepID=A0A0E9SP47_ANGAN
MCMVLPNDYFPGELMCTSEFVFSQTF